MPDFKREIRDRLGHLNLEPTREAAIVEEMSQHMEQRFEELVAQGASRAAAEEAVLRELSAGQRLEKELLLVEKHVPVEPALPETISFRGALGRTAKDFRYALRTIRLNPGVSLVVVLSLALGIGANTAIFQLLDAVRMRTLPVKHPEQLVDLRVGNMKSRRGEGRGNYPNFSNPVWEQIRDHQEAFSGMAAWNSQGVNLATGGLARNARALYVNGDFFNALGVPPVLGRVFNTADDTHGCGLPGVVISYAFWQKQFGGQASAVGSKLTVEGHPVEVLGVTGPEFTGVEVGRGFDLAIPICSEPVIAGDGSLFNRRDGWWLAVIGRLKPGWDRARATALLEAISPAIFAATLPAGYQPELAKQYLGWKLTANPAGTGLSRLRGKYEEPLWILLAISGTVLLIACANLANLMLARASAREREIAVRLALGASRWRLIQQLMMENLLLAFIGAGAGVLLAQGLTRALISFFTTQFSRVILNLAVDWRVLGFTAGIAILTCLFFGLMPAIKSTATPPIVAMKTGSRGVSSGRERFALRRMLVVAQVAMSMVLLVSAFLFVRSFNKLITLDAGFRQNGVLVAYMDFSQLKLPKERRTAYKQELVERMQRLPGVDAAAFAEVVPVSGNRWNEDVHYDDHGQDVHVVVNFNAVSAGYFKAMGTPLIQGRDVGPQDTFQSQHVAVVNQSFIKKVLKGAEPVGKVFHVDMGSDKPANEFRIVGVVKDTKYEDLQTDFGPIAYLPYTENPNPDSSAQIVIHSELALDSLMPAVERAAVAANPAIVVQFTELKSQVRDTLQRERLMASLSGFFGGLAGVLATIGLYGVISYMVVRRRNEIGIRMALGADRGRVLRLVLREAATLLAIGVVTGSAISLAATRAAASLLYGLKPYDPFTLAMAAASLAVIAAAATYLPAFRATQIHPTEALREE
jgi:putative ABC transport system permease protein